MSATRSKAAAPARPLPTGDEGAVLSQKTKVLFGFAALGTNTVLNAFLVMQTIFFQDYLGLGAGWFTAAMVIYSIWNAINDPWFGYLTDNTRSSRGRRLPYMRYAAPVLAFSFFLIWLAPPGASDGVIFAWMLVAMLLFDAAYTVIGLVYSALVPELSEAENERSGLQISFSLFGLLGTLIGFVLPDLFRPKQGDESLLPFYLAMGALGVFAMLAVWITAANVRERPEFVQVDPPMKLGASIRHTLTSKSFLILVAANWMSILVSTMVIGSLLYLADYVLRINTMILYASIFVPLIIGVICTTYVRRRVGVARAEQIFLVITAAGLIGVWLAPRELILPCLSVAGFGLAGPQTLTNLLFAQVIDEDELRTFARREGAFFGINALLTKPAQQIAPAVVALLLSSAGFIPREANAGVLVLDQPAAVEGAIRMVSGLIPGAAMLLGALILSVYPLKGGYLRQVQEELLALHAKKREILAGRQAGDEKTDQTIRA
ncbi:MAG TPA: MFS transporter [Chloroflexi bacterium]|jgi:GPH family glycoside/pentoside/hexuronide:cation symporter|nr:MFS transporter [Chloroflexota bacterium]